MKKKLVISLLIIIIVFGATFAWVSWNSSTNTNVSIEIDECTVVKYEEGADIISSSLIPTLTKEEGIVKDITINLKESCEQSASTNLYLNINSMGTGLNYEYFKWELYKNGSSLASGNFKDKETGDVITLTTNQTITTNQDTYTLYLWIDGNVDNPVSIDNQTFDFNLYATGTGRLQSDYNVTGTCGEYCSSIDSKTDVIEGTTVTISVKSVEFGEATTSYLKSCSVINLTTKESISYTKSCIDVENSSSYYNSCDIFFVMPTSSVNVNCSFEVSNSHTGGSN